MIDPDRTDRRLVESMLSGDERAFETFVEEYHPRLFRFAFRRVGGAPGGQWHGAPPAAPGPPPARPTGRRRQAAAVPPRPRICDGPPRARQAHRRRPATEPGLGARPGGVVRLVAPESQG